MPSQRSAGLATLLRSTIAIICAASVVGMIVCAVTKHLGGVITLGCIAAASIVVLMASVAVERDANKKSPISFDEDQARNVEMMIGRLVASPPTEAELRELVGQAVRLGRGDRTAR